MDSSKSLGTTHVLVLNALVDVIEGSRNAVADSRSRGLIEEVFDETIAPSESEQFRRVVHSLSDISVAEYRKREEVIDRVVEQVGEALERRGVRIVLKHESRVEFTGRQTALYSYAVSPSTDVLGALDLSPDVEAVVNDGVRLAAEGEFERAADRLESVIDAASSDEESVTVSILAGWAHFWAGDDQSAADLAGEAMDLEGDRWTTKALWIAATHTYADQIRDEELIVRMIFNWICDVPTGASIDIDVSLGDGGEPDWKAVDTELGFIVLDELAGEIRYRLRLEGTIERFPQLHGYYFGLATVYPDWHEIREVERTIHSGPETADPVERIVFRED